MTPGDMILGIASDVELTQVCTTNFHVIVEVLGPLGCFFGSFLSGFGSFLGFENIVGGAQSVVNGIRKYRRRSPKQSVVNGIFFYDFHETAWIKSV